MSELELVFVVGCQRSGTTLTGQILGAHPSTLLVDEQDGLYAWFDALESGGDAAAAATDKLVHRARTKYIRPDARVRLGEGTEMRPAPDVTHLILKAPNLTYAAERIARLGRKAHIVYPVRDPRAVVASMGRLTHVDMIGNQIRWMRAATSLADRLEPLAGRLETDRSLSDVGRRALIWQVKSSLMDTFRAAGLNPFVFRYEDLVADLSGHCAAMARHCGLSDDIAMTEHEAVYVGHSPDGVTPRDRKVDASSLVQWQADLSDQSLAEIAREAGPLAAHFGYAFGDVVEAGGEAGTGKAPLVLTGRGGGGTRLFSELARSAGIFLGNEINETGDSVEWVDALYGAAITTLDGGTPDARTLRRTGLAILDRATAGGEPDKSEAWGWKLPESMLAMPAIAAAFPDARIVHILRHPVTASLRRTHVTSRANNPVGAAVLREAYTAIGRDTALIGGDPDYLRNAISWLFQVRQVRDFGRNHLPPDQYLELRYEDLCSRPKAVIARLAGFAGLAADRFTAPTIDSTRTRSFAAGDPHIAEVWALCGDVGSSLGYGLSADGHPIVSGNV
ncbi:sulfotransferase [Maricaulis sp.]|uniref:sulfotransferase family protein n=1 Tax=Maricaulis sp. TaxID=1486257 RepID=UPI0025B96EB6|nr:sulfotransferase [Maricaulis sp.]